MAWNISQRLLITVIFLSGFSALVYQLIWTRLLGLVFGVSSFAVATVVAIFLLGLGIGSYYFGRIADRSRNPIRTYAALELSIAALSVFTYFVITTTQIYEIPYRYAYNSLGFYGMSIVRLLLSFFILFPPVFAIGGTVPLISKYALTTPRTLGSEFSTIYYVNTLGAFAGTILTGFFLVRHFGVFATLMIAVAMNTLIAIALYANKQTIDAPAEDVVPVSIQSTKSYMLLVLFVTGLISLAYEILWTRILSNYGISTSQSFALILSGFLLGFALGSYVISKKIDSTRNLEVSFGRISVLTAISGSLVLYIFQRFEFIAGVAARSASLPSQTTSLILAFVVSLLPAVFMGMLFPLGLRIYTNDVKEIGTKVGKIFVANTAGAVSGSLLAGFFLIPFVGMWNTTLVLVNLSLAVALYVFLKNGKLSTRTLLPVLLVFLITNAMIFSDKKVFHRNAKGYRVIYYSEGLSGTVTVLEQGNVRGLVVDSQYVAGTDPVLTIDSKMLAHLPLLLSDAPETALTVGYGSGGTSYSMLLHGVAVDAVEIEEKVVEASHLFDAVNFSSQEHPQLKVTFDDARNYINLVDKEYDVIVTDVTNLKYKRNPYLYTQEYFEIMKKALRDNGVAAAWLPIGGLSFRDLRVLIGTFKSVYPHTTAWYFTQYPTHFIVLVGTQERVSVDLDGLASKMRRAEQDLKLIGVDNEYELANMLLLGEKDVEQLTAGQDIHTDDFPVLEFSDMALYMQADLESNLRGLLSYQKEDLSRYYSGNDSQINRLEKYLKAAKSFFSSYAAGLNNVNGAEP